MVESSKLSNLTSMHTVFIPLENGLQLLQVEHDGTSNELILNSQHTVSFSAMNGIATRCSALNAHKIGSVYYLPCVNMESLYVCALNVNLTGISESNIDTCEQMPFYLGNTGYSSLSNIILFNDTSVTRQHLLFLLQNYLYRFYPVNRRLLPVYDFSSLCSSTIRQLLLSPKVNNELLLYCSDRTSIVFSSDNERIVNPPEIENVQYPCSQSAEFIIHLSQPVMDFSYKVTTSGNDVVKIFESRTTSNDFYSGVCFELRDGHIFAYVEQTLGVYLFNSTTANFTILPGTQGCSNPDCELLLKYDNRYLILRNREQKRITVYDVIESKAVITSSNATFRLVGLITDLQVVISAEDLTTTNILSSTTISGDVISTNSSNPPHSLGMTAIIVIVVFLIAIIIALIVVISIIIVYACKR